MDNYIFFPGRELRRLSRFGDKKVRAPSVGCFPWLRERNLYRVRWQDIAPMKLDELFHLFKKRRNDKAKISRGI
jgi:hypothetical protein